MISTTWLLKCILVSFHVINSFYFKNRLISAGALFYQKPYFEK